MVRFVLLLFPFHPFFAFLFVRFCFFACYSAFLCVFVSAVRLILARQVSIYRGRLVIRLSVCRSVTQSPLLPHGNYPHFPVPVGIADKNIIRDHGQFNCIRSAIDYRRLRRGTSRSPYRPLLSLFENVSISSELFVNLTFILCQPTLFKTSNLEFWHKAKIFFFPI